MFNYVESDLLYSQFPDLKTKLLKFVATEGRALPSILFKIWRYILRTYEIDGVLYKNKRKIIVYEDSNIELDALNSFMEISFFTDKDDGKKYFYLKMKHLEYNIGKDLFIECDDTLQEYYRQARDVYNAVPRRQRKKNKIKNSSIVEKKEIIVDLYPWRKEIQELCEELKVKYHFAHNSIFISTAFGRWRIDEEELENNQENFTLFHQNNVGQVNKYHRQKFRPANVNEAIMYIYKHDYLQYSIDTKNFVIT